MFVRREAADLGERPAEADQAEVEQVRPADEVKYQRPGSQHRPPGGWLLLVKEGEHPKQHDAEHNTEQAQPEPVRLGGHHVQDAQADHDCHAGDGDDAVHENINHAARIEPKTPRAGKF